MRKGRRTIGLVMLGLALWGALARGDDMLPATPEAARTARPVRMSLEIRWGASSVDFAPTPEAGPLRLTVEGGGRVLDAVTWPFTEVSVPGSGPQPVAPDVVQSAWDLGSSRDGRVRVRLEAPLDALLRFEAAGQEVLKLPLLALLNGPARTKTGTALDLEVTRLPWDVIEVQTASNGVAAPGELIPVTVAFNVLTPEPTEVELSIQAVLRPLRATDPLWKIERQVIVPTNSIPAHARILSIPAPRVPGTYQLELAATWRPTRSQQEGTVLGSWWRSLKMRSADTATRRLSFAVLAPDQSPPAERARKPDAEVVVDSVDLGRPRGLRPFTSGHAPRADAPDGLWRIPDALLVEPQRRERIWSLISRVGTEFRPLPPATADEFSWLAIPLRLTHPNRPHRLDLNVVGGNVPGLSVALVAPGARPRLLLDAQGSGPLIPEGGVPLGLSWPVWPDTTEAVLVVVNRSAASPLWLGNAQLVELPDNPAPLVVDEPASQPRREVGVVLSAPRALDRFGGAADDGPTDSMTTAANLLSYLRHCGATMVVLSPSAADRSRRLALEGQAAEDAAGPDRLELVLRVLTAQGLRVLLEARPDGPLEGLPAPSDPDAIRRGLTRIGRDGQPDGAEYNLLHPDVQKAISQRLMTVGAGATNAHGLLLRLGRGPTLLGRPDTGLDDETYTRFVREAIGDGKAPGLDTASDDRFRQRTEFVTGPGLVPWLAWRTKQVGVFYHRLAGELKQVDSRLDLVLATPGLEPGPVSEEAMRCDRDGLTPDQGWRAVGLDLEKWPTERDGPIVLRGVEPAVAGLEADLAIDPRLDAQVRPRPLRGSLIGLGSRKPVESSTTPSAGGLYLRATALAHGPEGDQPLGHALAAIDAHWILVDASTVLGQEARVRQFARVFRALPVTDAIPPSPAPERGGVVARAVTAGDSSFVTLANDTPYPVRLLTVLESPPVAVDDLARGHRLRHEAASAGGKRVVLDLPPFGVTTLRVAAPKVRVRSATPYFDPARDRHREEVAQRLRLLASGASLESLNPHFEPTIGPDGTALTATSSAAPDGWSVEGTESATIALDTQNPRRGLSSLRLASPDGPAQVSSIPFLAPAETVTLQAWLRADPPDTGIQIRLESEPADGSSTPPVRLIGRLPARGRAEWSYEALRAAGLPTDGLSRILVRFELMGPGTLWIDDLALVGAGQAQAKSCLTAALQAYDEGRYADFARLANSHWARDLSIPAPVATAAEPAPTRTGNAATDLPTRPRLR